jgi:hypothetical protein
MPGTNSRDGTPLSLTPFAIIAILVLILHIASGDLLGRLHARACRAGRGSEVSGGCNVASAFTAV